MVDKTGVLATVIGPGATGVQAYVGAVNAAGGVNGRKIDLDILDSQSVPNVAAGLFQKVLSDPPIALIFLGQSSSQTQSQQILASAALPVFTETVDDSFLYPAPRKNIFMSNASATQQGQALLGKAAQLLGGSLKGKKLALVAVSTAYTDSLIAAIEAVAKQR